MFCLRKNKHAFLLQYELKNKIMEEIKDMIRGLVGMLCIIMFSVGCSMMIASIAYQMWILLIPSVALMFLAYIWMRWTTKRNEGH